MSWTAPRPNVASNPIESVTCCDQSYSSMLNVIGLIFFPSRKAFSPLWLNFPSRMYMHISISLWGWQVNPLLGCTRSSFKTRKTPNPVFARLLYSAKEKWNLDLSQFLFVHFGFDSLAGLSNQDGLGSLT